MVNAGVALTAFLERDQRVTRFADLLDRAGIQMSPLEVAGNVVGLAALSWFFYVFTQKPNPLAGLLFFFIACVLSSTGFWFLLQRKVSKRLDRFVEQLELALRLVSSGVRIGLGLRQALTVIIEEMPDPARYEYKRVIGQANIGVSVFDALDELARRMPGNETLMMAHAIRIQGQTGGDLAIVLEHLADTIKERRRIQRKIQALTAEGRASAGILTALPPFLSVFLALTEHGMGAALFLTGIGHIALLGVAVLEGLGVFTLLRMLKVDI
jgi:tight adherence protein B